MKIFYFPSFYPSERPGEKWLGAFTHRQVKALKELGVDIEVVLPIPDYPIWPFYLFFKDWRRNKKSAHPVERVFDGIKVFHPRIPTPKPNRFFKSFRDAYTHAVSDFLRRRKIEVNDTFLFAQWLPEAGIVVEVGRAMGVKVAILGIGDDIIKVPHQSAQHLDYFKACWKNADLRSVVADYLGKAANSIVGQRLPYEVFYSSVNDKEFFPVSIEEKQKLRQEIQIGSDVIVILCVASPIIRKGWLDLFEALAGIDNDNYLLLAINGGQKELNLVEEARKRGLETNFKDIGEVSAGEIRKYYQLSDIFCLPSHWEGLANALLEAMATGLPVITTNVSGHPEVITDGVNGFMIDVGDKEKLRIKLNSLLLDSDLRNQLGNNAQASVKNVPGSHKVTALKILKTLSKLNQS